MKRGEGQMIYREGKMGLCIFKIVLLEAIVIPITLAAYQTYNGITISFQYITNYVTRSILLHIHYIISNQMPHYSFMLLPYVVNEFSCCAYCIILKYPFRLKMLCAFQN